MRFRGLYFSKREQECISSDTLAELSNCLRKFSGKKYIITRIYELRLPIRKCWLNCLLFLPQTTIFRGTKRLVSVNVFSVVGNSADICVGKVSPEIFVTEGKMNAYYFRREKLSFRVRKKPSYYFRKTNISCKIRGIQFCSLQFSNI